MKWATVPLGELGELRNGLNYTSENAGSGLKMINVADFGSRSFPDFANLGEISPAGLDLELIKVRPGDILFVRSNGNAELVGRSLMIPEHGETPVGFSAFCIRFRTTSTEANPQFLSYFFRSRLFRQALSANAIGTNIRNLNQGLLSNSWIPLPHLSVQSRVADLLSAYDDLIENNRRRIAILEALARNLYQEWFVRLRFPGHETTKMVDGVPEGWERVELGELCFQRKSSVDPATVDPATPYVGLEHMPRRSITLGEWESASKVQSTKLKFEEGDILFGKIRPYFHKVGIAICAGVTSSDALVLRPTHDQTASYILCLLSSDEFIALVSKSVREGSKMPRADWPFLTRQMMWKPPIVLLRAFEGVVAPIVAEARSLALYNRALSRARDLLLPRLMSGELEV